uniref:Uncharacterized protein n=1 Tax=Zea mays TaxID=4577 RepID=C4J974_MAIZE|nr:unknown [Zea mays]
MYSSPPAPAVAQRSSRAYRRTCGATWRRRRGPGSRPPKRRTSRSCRRSGGASGSSSRRRTGTRCPPRRPAPPPRRLPSPGRGRRGPPAPGAARTAGTSPAPRSSAVGAAAPRSAPAASSASAPRSWKNRHAARRRYRRRTRPPAGSPRTRTNARRCHLRCRPAGKRRLGSPPPAGTSAAAVWCACTACTRSMDQEGGGKAELSARSSSTNQERNNSAVAGRTCRCLLRWYSVSPGTAIALSTDLGVALSAPPSWATASTKRSCSWRVHLSRALASPCPCPCPCC